MANFNENCPVCYKDAINFCPKCNKQIVSCFKCGGKGKSSFGVLNPLNTLHTINQNNQVISHHFLCII